MSTETLTPGIYIEEDATPSVSVSHGATAVPLFIGQFIARAPLADGEIVRISSWLDFSSKFMTADKIALEIASGAEEAFSAEDAKGGSAALNAAAPQIGKVSVQPANAAAIQLYFQNGGGVCYISALAKDDAESLSALSEKIKQVEAITLLVCCDADKAFKQRVYTSLLTLLVDNRQGYFLLADSPDGKSVPGISESEHVAAYYPPLIPAASSRPADRLIEVKGVKDPDGKPLMSLAELKKAFPELASAADQKINTALEATAQVCASAVMAGVYAATDRSRGVWKAPANVVLNGIAKASVAIDDDMQQTMNPSGINAIRHFADRGLVVWGARTLKDSDEWRYIPVRRLFSSAERDIKKAMRPMVFEANAQPTWTRVAAAIENYLHGLWQQGALAGNSPEAAYFVQIGLDVTMTQTEIDQGKMVVKIGLAAVRPAEFIVLQFTQNMAQ